MVRQWNEILNSAQKKQHRQSSISFWPLSVLHIVISYPAFQPNFEIYNRWKEEEECQNEDPFVVGSLVKVDNPEKNGCWRQRGRLVHVDLFQGSLCVRISVLPLSCGIFLRVWNIKEPMQWTRTTFPGGFIQSIMEHSSGFSWFPSWTFDFLLRFSSSNSCLNTLCIQEVVHWCQIWPSGGKNSIPVDIWGW